MACSISDVSVDHRSIAIQAMAQKQSELQFLAERVGAAFPGVSCIGPSLNFLGREPERQLWKVSMMLMTLPDQEQPPKVRLKKGGANAEMLPQLVDEWKGYKFFRYDFAVKQAEDTAQKIVYHVGDKRFKFHVPAVASSAKMLFTSCNGVQSEKDARKFKDKGGLMHMWDAIAELHKEPSPSAKGEDEHDSGPFHINMVNGDACYMDGIEKVVDPVTGVKMYVPTGVLTLPSILEWLKLPDEERNSFPLTDEMEEELETFYFYKYMLHFFNNGNFTEILASVPGIMQWGDHDTIDGNGSYPPALQNSPPMQAIRRIAQRAYLLFQQHTSHTDPEKCTTMGLSGKQGYSFLRDVGADTFVLGVDTRSERTREQVVDPDSWNDIFEALEEMPRSCRHLLVMLELPIVYPSLKALGKFLNEVQEEFQGEGIVEKFERHMLKKIPEFLNAFRLIELTDDVDDGWSSHPKEVEMLIARLMDFVERRSKDGCLRVTFLGGDAHWATQGLVGPFEAELDKDPRVMAQLVSSAVGNVPPPKAMTKLFELYMKDMNERIAPNAYAKMMPIAKVGGGKDSEEKWKVILSKRNFATINVRDGNVVWRLYVEPKRGARITDLGIYKLVIPSLQPGISFDEYDGDISSNSTPSRAAPGSPSSRRSTPSPRVPPAEVEVLEGEDDSFHTARSANRPPPISKKHCCVVL